MPRVIHFEIHADDPDRAIRFYREMFGWEFTKWAGPMDYWLIKTGAADQPGIDGGLLRRHGPIDGQAVTAYVCTVDVPSVDAAVGALQGAGGAVAMPKMPIPGVGWLAYAKDSEGNLFGLLQPDPTAQ